MDSPSNVHAVADAFSSSSISSDKPKTIADVPLDLFLTVHQLMMPHTTKTAIELVINSIDLDKIEKLSMERDQFRRELSIANGLMDYYIPDVRKCNESQRSHVNICISSELVIIDNYLLPQTSIDDRLTLANLIDVAKLQALVDELAIYEYELRRADDIMSKFIPEVREENVLQMREELME